MQINHRELLTNEQQIEAREWERLFASPAWKWLTELYAAMADKAKTAMLYGAATEGEMRQARGALLEMERLLLLEASMEAMYNGFIEDARLASDELEDSLGANS